MALGGGKGLGDLRLESLVRRLGAGAERLLEAGRAVLGGLDLREELPGRPARLAFSAAAIWADTRSEVSATAVLRVPSTSSSWAESRVAIASAALRLASSISVGAGGGGGGGGLGRGAEVGGGLGRGGQRHSAGGAPVAASVAAVGAAALADVRRVRGRVGVVSAMRAPPMARRGRSEPAAARVVRRGAARRSAGAELRVAAARDCAGRRRSRVPASATSRGRTGRPRCGSVRSRARATSARLRQSRSARWVARSWRRRSATKSAEGAVGEADALGRGLAGRLDGVDRFLLAGGDAVDQPVLRRFDVLARHGDRRLGGGRGHGGDLGCEGIPVLQAPVKSCHGNRSCVMISRRHCRTRRSAARS